MAQGMFLNQSEVGASLLRSTAIRQTLLLFAVFALFTSMAWLATYWMVVRDTNGLVESRLETLIDDAVSAIERGESLPSAGPSQYLALITPSKERQGRLPEDVSVADRASGLYQLETAVGSGQTDYVVLVKEAAGARLIAAENVERLEETTDIFLAGLQIALLTSLMATFVAGFLIARRNQNRLNRISSTLAKVSQGELDSRIQLSGPTDDLSLLADRIDETTSRLETTMTQMRVQTANIAHDLRTPLARLRALLENAYTTLAERQQPVASQTLSDALDQIDHIVGTFNALLRIASVESGEKRSSFVTVELSELIHTVTETFGPVIEDKGQTLQVLQDQPAKIVGDPDMIIQLLGNLLQNALRHGAPNQIITLRAEGTRLSVTDQGPGIPESDRVRVLQPLYQLDRQRQGEGYGLGLSLVTAISALHEAMLQLDDGPTGVGLTVTVVFPSNTQNY